MFSKSSYSAERGNHKLVYTKNVIWDESISESFLENHLWWQHEFVCMEEATMDRVRPGGRMDLINL